jgi:hypothetical protein
MSILTIQDRLKGRRTVAFVTGDTVDLLADKLVGIIGDRRMTKVHRYVGDTSSTLTVEVGLHLNHGALGGAVRRQPGLGVHVYLGNPGRRFDGIGIGTHHPEDTEESIRERYHHPEKQWLGQRRDITLVELAGWAGQPRRDDKIRIECWNQHGVGQETTLVFDDLDLIDELSWDVKGDAERRVYWDDSFCDSHGQHVEDPRHPAGACEVRRSTRAEDLAALAYLASVQVDGAR